MNRNEFFKVSAGFICGLSIPGVWGATIRAAETPSAKGIALDDSYLFKGLNALARAHRMSAMAGHLGASLVAGYFVAKQRPDLDPEVYKGIEGDLDRVMAGDSVFGSKMSKNSKIMDSKLFEDFPKEKPKESLIDALPRFENPMTRPRKRHGYQKPGFFSNDFAKTCVPDLNS